MNEQNAELLETGHSPLPKNAYFRNLYEVYRRLFSVGEIEQDKVLQWMAGAVLLGFAVTYASWMNVPWITTNAVDSGSYRCWPFLPNCADYIFLTTYPNGYSQTAVFMLLFAILVGCSYAIYSKDWILAHAGISVLFLFKIYFTFISYRFKGNYDYYHTVFCLVFLFFPHKKFFLQLSVVFFYFLSTAAKIHPSWVLGEYFTSLRNGLPLFPKGTEIIATNFLMFMEMVGAWFLFSSKRLVQRGVLTFFAIFHVYSGILVGYRYPATVLPALLVLFGPWFQAPVKIPSGASSVPGWALMGLLLVGQMVPLAISGDQKLTLEGNFYGLYMFEANHQCFGSIGVNGKTVDEFKSGNALHRCDPYGYFSTAKNRYCNPSNTVSLVLNHSINGGPFYQIVNVDDICKLEYKPFAHNSWIKTEKDAPQIGRPVQNFYRWAREVD